eukprot:11092999-Alexandrium_andersonii.AAC.1
MGGCPAASEVREPSGSGRARAFRAPSEGAVGAGAAGPERQRRPGSRVLRCLRSRRRRPCR